MIGMRLANSRRMLRLMSRASVFAAMNFSVLVMLRIQEPDQAAPRMLSLITLLSRSIACCDLANSLRTRPSTTLKVIADDGQDGQHGKAELPVDREQQHAGADDQEHRRDERADRLRRRTASRRRRRRSGSSAASPGSPLDVGGVLRRELRHQLRPQIPGHPFGGAGSAQRSADR